MRFTLLSLFAAGLLLAACESTPDSSEGGTGDGMAADEEMVDSGEMASDDMIDAAPIDPRSAQYVTEVLGDRVYFDLDSSAINASAHATVKRWAEWMTGYGDVVVTIEGHCDERGTREYNLALGDRRANAVKNYLVALGVDASRIATISYGKERPAVEGQNEAAWSQNRRGVLVLE